MAQSDKHLPRPASAPFSVRECSAATALVGLVLALVVLGLRAAHFVGISNDDAARTLIASDFSRLPTLDPTRSSWLPVHSYLLGTWLRLWPDTWIAPRVFSALAATTLAVALFVAARAAGTTRLAAVTSAALGLCAPWVVFAAWAPGVPEVPCAMFFALGVSALGSDPPPRGRARRIWLGAAFVALACGHRYEAWFAAAGLALAVALERPGAGRRALLGAVLVLAVVPAGWLAINFARTGDPLDFVHRVVRFRATQEALPSTGRRLGRYPWMLLREAGVVLALASLVPRAHRRRAARWSLPALCAVLGLIATEVRGGGATHHVDRALMLSVVALAVPAAMTLDGWWRRGGAARGAAVAAAVVALAQLARGFAHPPRDVDAATADAGRFVAAEPPRSCYLVELERQDFLWVEVASAMPRRARPDRRYGAAPPDPASLPALARGCDLAVVSTPLAFAALVAGGWTAAAFRGPWSILRAPAR